MCRLSIWEAKNQEMGTKIRVADYIEQFLAEHGIVHVFTVVGGGAMHLNDAFGHSDRLKCIYHHHEQAAAIAAEAYYRVDNRMAAVCVTSGPGATNAITGVAGAWVDSIPMLVISGQTKTELTVKHSGLSLRTLGNQEIDIVPMVEHITKYCVMIEQAEDIRYILEKALFLAQEGRPGPCWLDIPVDIQGKMVDADLLKGFDAGSEGFRRQYEADDEDIAFIMDKIRNAERPVIYAGSAIRTSGNYEEFAELVSLLKIPVVTCWNSIDEIATDSPYYAGRGGIMGDRAGNFAVQNSDLVLSLGSRLNIYQVGYDIRTWARESYCIAVDIDAEELKKPTVRIEKAVCADVGSVIAKITELVKKGACTGAEERGTKWQDTCTAWKQRYPVVRKEHYCKEQEFVNVYAFIDCLSRKLRSGAVTVVANGSASVVGSQSYYIREGQRFLMNCALSSMGYDLPAAIGACAASGSREVICIAGDGSLQMNLQELQTIRTNQLPVKLFVINNGGYQQIRLTQKNIFGNEFVGVGEESKDLGFPACEGLAALYGFSFYRCTCNQDMEEVIDRVLQAEGPVLCEVVVTKDQIFEPKSAARKLEDGRIVSPPLEDLAPFLPREELEENMIIECIKEE